VASNWFLALEGITGDSTAEGHENELQVGSWSWGLSNERTPTTGSATARPVLEALVVEVSSDPGALQLVRFCAFGRQAATGTLTGVRAGGQPFTYLRYQMQRIAVTSVHEDTRDDGSLRHSVTLEFRGLKATFIPQNSDGTPGTPLQVEVGNLTP
jgi:type VI secretion system secreted protein Hcp